MEEAVLVNRVNNAGSLETMISCFFDDAYVHGENEYVRQWNDAGRSRLIGYGSTLASFAYYAAGGGCIVEIGSYAGFGTMALAYGACKGGAFCKVYSIDIDDVRQRSARRRIERCGLLNANYLHGDSKLVSGLAPVGLAYIDGDHTHDGCLYDLRNIAPHVWPEGKMLCHDYGRADQPGYHQYQNGVTSAIDRFLRENADWYGTWIGDGFMLLARRVCDPVQIMARRVR